MQFLLQFGILLSTSFSNNDVFVVAADWDAFL